MSDESKRTWLTHPGKPGVIYREHPTRKTARKPNRFWAIRHRAGGKRLVETLGWTSEGWTADMAHALLVELQHNVKLGLRPQTLKEKRELAAGAKAEAARQSALEGLKEITFGELAGFYREWAAANRRSGAGVARILDRHVLPELGEKRAADITPAAVNELKALLEAKRPERGRGQNDPDARLSPQTVLHCLKTVREVYNYALETPHPDMPERMLYAGKNPAILSRRGRGVRVPVERRPQAAHPDGRRDSAAPRLRGAAQGVRGGAARHDAALAGHGRPVRGADPPAPRGCGHGTGHAPHPVGFRFRADQKRPHAHRPCRIPFSRGPRRAPPPCPGRFPYLSRTGRRRARRHGSGPGHEPVLPRRWA